MSKICNKCFIEKDLDCFYKSKNTKDGYRNDCKKCKSLIDKKYREDNKEKLIIKKREYHYLNRDELLKKKRIYWEENKDRLNLKRLEKARLRGIKPFNEAQKIRGEKTRGKNNPNWKGGQGIKNTIRKSTEYKKWRTECFERDDYTCQVSGKKGGDLVVHHLKPFYILISDLDEDTFRFDDKLFDINNGITISKDLHYKFHKNYGFSNFNENDFNEFKKNI